jgi:MFS family permease
MKGLGGYSGICALMILDGNFADSVEGWRWIFIMEGLLTILASLLSVFFLVPFPEQNKMFPEKEKACVLARKADEEVEDSDEPVWKHTLAACRDLKVWLA